MASKKKTLNDTGERMIPEFHKGNFMYGEHMVRYIAAEDIVKGKIVLDIACGSGYGTAMIAKNAKKVIGVDVDESTVNYAKNNYQKGNIEFLVGDGINIPVEDNSVDAVVTFETIEHIKDYDKFLKEVKRVLKHDGLLLISTPNDVEFSEGNHFHLHQFKYDEFINMLQQSFAYQKTFLQSAFVGNAILSLEELQSEWAKTTQVINMAPKDVNKTIYFFSIASNVDITVKLEPIVGMSEHWSRRSIEEAQKLTNDHIRNITTLLDDKKHEVKLLKDELQSIKTSKSWRLARKISSTKSRLLPR